MAYCHVGYALQACGATIDEIKTPPTVRVVDQRQFEFSQDAFAFQSALECLAEVDVTGWTDAPSVRLIARSELVDASVSFLFREMFHQSRDVLCILVRIFGDSDPSGRSWGKETPTTGTPRHQGDFHSHFLCQIQHLVNPLHFWGFEGERIPVDVCRIIVIILWFIPLRHHHATETLWHHLLDARHNHVVPILDLCSCAARDVLSVEMRIQLHSDGAKCCPQGVVLKRVSDSLDGLLSACGKREDHPHEESGNHFVNQACMGFIRFLSHL